MIDALNLHRRNLEIAERIMIAAKVTNLRRGGDRRSEDFKVNACSLKNGEPEAVTVANAAKRPLCS